MIRYLGLRTLAAIPTVLGVVTLVFSLIHLMPGDPVDVMLGETARPADRAKLRTDLGLERPLLEQYGGFISGLLSGDMGSSIHSGKPVSELIRNRFPATVELTLAALVFALAIGIPAGLWSASRPYQAADRVTLATSLFGVAIPNFWLGPMLILLFSLRLSWFPVSGRGGISHLVLPAVTLGLSLAGVLTRMTRSTVMETLGEDYIRTARAKGLSETVVVAKHALANATSPLLSVVGLQLGALLAGSVITETIFSWPGLGRLTVEAIQTRDYPVVQGCILVVALSYVFVNLATDLAYAWANPKLREDLGG
jgi:peptide/nickel transport system permease protein